MQNKNKKSPKRPLNAYARFSGVAIQMGVIIALGAMGGSALDEKFENKTPWITIVLSLLAIGIALYLVIREVTKTDK